MTSLLRRRVRPTLLLVLAAPLLVLVGGLHSGPAGAQEVITNESLVAMTRAGLPEAVIIAKLRSTPSALDLRIDALIALKQAGVSDRVLEAMVATGSGGAGEPARLTALPAPPSSLAPPPPPPEAPPLPAPAAGPPSMPAPAPAAWSGAGAAPSAAEAEDGLGAMLSVVKTIADLVTGSGAQAARARSGRDASAPMPEPVAANPGLPPLMAAPLPAPAADAPPPLPLPPLAQGEIQAPAATSPSVAAPVATSPAAAPLAGSGLSLADFAPQRGRLGVRVDPLTAETAQAPGSNVTEGVVVREVLPGSAAAAAGLRSGDVVTRVNGQGLRSSEELGGALAHRMRGERTRLSVMRGGAAGEIVVPAASEFPLGADQRPATTKPEASKPAATPQPPASALASVAGTYRCWMFNVGGAGGRCRNSPPIVLRADGSYEESSTRGTWALRGSQVLLSASTVRGAGRLESGNHIVFEYVYNGQPHRVTYLRHDGAGAQGPVASAGGAVASPPALPAAPAGAVSRVPVELTIRFAPSDGSVGWINSVALIPAGRTTGPEALGRTDGKRSVAASFRSVEAGHLYTVHVSSGLHRWPVGTLDLRAPAGPVALTVDAPPPAARRESGAPAPRDAVAPAGAEQAGAAAGKPCDLRLPRYTQKGCTE
ncbi:MAG: PDZ domain-containing protein [Candidatus Rokubacteria bacterium]|nr:PDZ domain-containing protein [Candidatus Rokubacteria bacterium]